MGVGANTESPVQHVDVLVAGLGPGGCAAALAAVSEGLSTMAVDARGAQATRAQLILIRPGAREALRQLGLPDITDGRRTTTIRHVENRLRSELVAAAKASLDAATHSAPASSRFELHWHTSVVALEAGEDRVRVQLRDETTGLQRTVMARHVVDASGGRLESLGRPVRERAGPGHLVVTAEYAAPPWFDGIVGMRDASTHELYLLFPTWGRKGVIAYFDSAPGSAVDAQALSQRFETIAERLGLGPPNQPIWTVDVFQRALKHPNRDRVVPIGDSVGTVDVLLGAGLSTAIEDGVDVGRAIARAQREPSPAGESALTHEVSERLFARHRATVRKGRLMLAVVRPILERAWPAARLPEVSRPSLGKPPFLWPAIRFVFGRRPQPS